VEELDVAGAAPALPVEGSEAGLEVETDAAAATAKAVTGTVVIPETETAVGDALARAAAPEIEETAEAAAGTTTSTIRDPAPEVATAVVASRREVDEAASVEAEAADPTVKSQAPEVTERLSHKKLFKRARRKTEYTSATSHSKSDGTTSRSFAEEVGRDIHICRWLQVWDGVWIWCKLTARETEDQSLLCLA
jgi:hypothetical protein